MVRQDFGYSATHFAGRAAGEMGGRIQRSSTPACYAAAIPARTLEEGLVASGSLAITSSEPGAGAFVGFFSSHQPGGSGRPIGSLGLNLDFERAGGRLAVRLITAQNRSCGTFITPYLPGKFRPTPIRNDGTRYHWTLAYEPGAADGNGRFTFTMRSDTHTTQDYGPLEEIAAREARARFPNTTTFVVDLPPGFKEEGTVFDRFGMMNMMKSGGAVTMYADDMRYDGRSEDFSTDPAWIGVGNRVSFEDREQVGAQDFGFSTGTSHAGGNPGEIGGAIWRTEGQWGYYADRLEKLTVDQPMEARGKVKLIAAGPDSDMCLGWFNSADLDGPPMRGKNFLGIHVGGPTRSGHYFEPQFVTGRGGRDKAGRGPLLRPGEACEWSLHYDPASNDGLGEIRVTLGDESVVLPFKRGRRAEGATFDRFGIFSTYPGGQMVKIYFDDLSYTVGHNERNRE